MGVLLALVKGAQTPAVRWNSFQGEASADGTLRRFTVVRRFTGRVQRCARPRAGGPGVAADIRDVRRGADTCSARYRPRCARTAPDPTPRQPCLYRFRHVCSRPRPEANTCRQTDGESVSTRVAPARLRIADHAWAVDALKTLPSNGLQPSAAAKTWRFVDVELRDGHGSQ